LLPSCCIFCGDICPFFNASGQGVTATSDH
jgi:hypothetical protein